MAVSPSVDPSDGAESLAPETGGFALDQRVILMMNTTTRESAPGRRIH